MKQHRTNEGDHMSTWAELVAEHATTDNTTDAARAILAALRVPKHAADVLTPIVANAVRITASVDRREVEQRAGVRAVVAGPATDRDEFCRTHFSLGDGKPWIAWGEATIAQHEQRIAFLAKLRGGIDVSIAKHQDAIDACVAAGVDCLNDLPVAA